MFFLFFFKFLDVLLITKSWGWGAKSLSELSTRKITLLLLPLGLKRNVFGVNILVQSDQLNMAVCFWYLVKRYLSPCVHYCTVACTGVTFYKVPEQHGHVYLVYLSYLHLFSINGVKETRS